MSEVTLYQGDCLEILPTLGKVNAVITDPPYGIGKLWAGGSGSGWKKTSDRPKERYEWDALPPKNEIFDSLLRLSIPLVIWGGNYFNLPPSRGWLVWNKPERGFSLSEAELAWTNKDTVIRVFDCHRSDVGREHPTQKPLSLMMWCIDNFTKPGDTVLDCFMGSGTTGVACVQTGRNFIGIEIDPTYFGIAEKRIKEAQMQMPLFGAI